MPVTSRREFLGQIACAFATAAIPCTIPPAAGSTIKFNEPVSLPPGAYNFRIQSIEHDRIMMEIIGHANKIVYGKLGTI